MAIKRVKPTSPGRRFQTYATFEEITKTTPEKGLLGKIKKTGGRNANGRITSRRRGGGHKRFYRIIDFKRDKDGIPATVKSIQDQGNFKILTFSMAGHALRAYVPEDQTVPSDNAWLRFPKQWTRLFADERLVAK